MSGPSKIYLMTSIMGLAAPLSAQTPSATEDLRDQIITGAWGDPAKCNLMNASPLPLLNAARDGGAPNGACVSITAYWKGGAIFANEADANLAKSAVTSMLKGRRVGVYADEQTLKMAPHRPEPFTIVGSYASCKTEWSGALMVMGYCHFSDGPFLKVSQTRPARRSDVR